MFAVQKKIRESKKVGKGTVKESDEVVELDMTDPEIIEEFWDLVEELLVSYTGTYRNIKDGEEAIEDTKRVIDLCGPENMPLMIEIFNELLGFSQGSGDLAKNSTSESGPENSGSVMIAEAAEGTASPSSETVEVDALKEPEASPSSTILEETPS